MAAGIPTAESLRIPINADLTFWLEGRLEAAERPGPVGVTVRLAGTVPLRVQELAVNGRRVPAARMRTAQSGWDWRTEALFDLAPALVPGQNQLRLAVGSQAVGYIHGMDIHEDTAALGSVPDA
jgi:hypothetical protein